MARIFAYLDRTQIAFARKGRIYEAAGKAERGITAEQVMEELRRIDAQEEILGPVAEILTAKET